MSGDTTMANSAAATSSPNVDPAIFTSLQSKIDEESAIRDELKAIVETLSKQGRLTQSILSRIHNTSTADLEPTVLAPCDDALKEQATTVKGLAQAASKYPFYKWNSVWQRDIQAVIGSMQLCDWLRTGNLLTLEEVGQKLEGKHKRTYAHTFLTFEQYRSMSSLKTPSTSRSRTTSWP
jgi:hypothetical protein